jgi:hypothetical protein
VEASAWVHTKRTIASSCALVANGRPPSRPPSLPARGGDGTGGGEEEGRIHTRRSSTTRAERMEAAMEGGEEEVEGCVVRERAPRRRR